MQKVAVTIESGQPLTKMEVPGQQQKNGFQQLLAQVTAQPQMNTEQGVVAETKPMQEEVPAEITALLNQLLTGQMAPQEVPAKLRPALVEQLTALISLNDAPKVKQGELAVPEVEASIKDEKLPKESGIAEQVEPPQVVEITMKETASPAKQQDLAPTDTEVLTQLTELVQALRSLAQEADARPSPVKDGKYHQLSLNQPVVSSDELNVLPTRGASVPGKQAVSGVVGVEAQPQAKFHSPVPIASQLKAGSTEPKLTTQPAELDLSSLVEQVNFSRPLQGQPASLSAVAKPEISSIKQVAQQLQVQLSPILEKSRLALTGTKQTLTLNLKPANLGTIKVVVQTSAQTVGLKFEVQNAGTKDLLQKVTQQLEQILDQFQTEPVARQAKEITPLKVALTNPVEQAQVDTQTSDLMQDQRQSQRQFSRSRRTKTPRRLTELVPVTQEKHERDGVISLLV